jgi:hypothetical protein
MLKEELREPRQYMNILEALAAGNTRVTTIANASGVSVKDLPAYLSTLVQLELVERLVPVTETKPISKHSMYRVKDPLLRFWFRFVLPNKSSLEIGNTGDILAFIKAHLSEHASIEFEKLCSEFLLASKPFPLSLAKVGRWWHKDVEIDIVGIDPIAKSIVFGECKFQDEVDGAHILKGLKAKAENVEWKQDDRMEYYIIFAKSFKKKIRGDEHERFIILDEMGTC